MRITKKQGVFFRVGLLSDYFFISFRNWHVCIFLEIYSLPAVAILGFYQWH